MTEIQYSTIKDLYQQTIRAMGSFIKMLIYMNKTLSGRLRELKSKDKVRLGNPKSGRCRLRELTVTVQSGFHKDGRKRPFPSSHGPLYQNEVKCSAFVMEMIFHSHANKTHFHKKGCALGLILKVRVFGTRKWPMRAGRLRGWSQGQLRLYVEKNHVVTKPRYSERILSVPLTLRHVEVTEYQLP